MAVFLLWGCDGASDEGERLAPTTTGAPAPPTLPAGSFVDCGRYEMTPAEPTIGPDAVTAQECLVEAFSEGNPARLVVTAPTDEGDPVVFTYTVTSEQVVTVHEDASADEFGPPYVREQTCRSLQSSEVAIPQFGECSEPETVFVDEANGRRSG